MKITLSKAKWEEMGKKAGWVKLAQSVALPKTEELPDNSTKIRATPDSAENLRNIAKWIKSNYFAKVNKKDHQLCGYVEQLFIIADEIDKYTKAINYIESREEMRKEISPTMSPPSVQSPFPWDKSNNFSGPR